MEKEKVIKGLVRTNAEKVNKVVKSKSMNGQSDMLRTALAGDSEETVDMNLTIGFGLECWKTSSDQENTLENIYGNGHENIPNNVHEYIHETEAWHDVDNVQQKFHGMAHEIIRDEINHQIIHEIRDERLGKVIGDNEGNINDEKKHVNNDEIMDENEFNRNRRRKIYDDDDDDDDNDDNEEEEDDEDEEKEEDGDEENATTDEIDDNSGTKDEKQNDNENSKEYGNEITKIEMQIENQNLDENKNKIQNHNDDNNDAHDVGNNNNKSSKNNNNDSYLPIDFMTNEIINYIKKHRVTVIQGETGCGKSSRVPMMILDHANNNGLQCRIVVRMYECTDFLFFVFDVFNFSLF